MISASHARELRAVMEDRATTLPDEVAIAVPELFPRWVPRAYEAGERVRHDGVLYRCVQAHPENGTYTPDAAVSLWARVLIPDPVVVPEWVQPDSTNPYMAGDHVMHGGIEWVSDYDFNTWEPGVAGWSVVE